METERRKGEENEKGKGFPNYVYWRKTHVTHDRGHKELVKRTMGVGKECDNTMVEVLER